MLELFLSFVLLYGVKSNVIVFNGSGVLTYQKEKQYFKFRILNSLFLAIGLIACLMISYVLYNYVYQPYDLGYLNVIISVLIVGIYNIIVSKIFALLVAHIAKSCSLLSFILLKYSSILFWFIVTRGSIPVRK